MEEDKIKIVIDDAIPFIQGVFEPYAEVVYKGGRDICREDLLDASALVIRTRTKCDADLLDGTAVKFIATATIGTDHIDHEYCDSKGIVVRNAFPPFTASLPARPSGLMGLNSGLSVSVTLEAGLTGSPVTLVSRS